MNSKNNVYGSVNQQGSTNRPQYYGASKTHQKDKKSYGCNHALLVTESTHKQAAF